MKVAWTEKAEKQLDQIFNYIAADSALYAYRTVEKIIEQAESIVPHPRKGRMVPEYEKRRHPGGVSSSLPHYLFD